MTCRITQVRTYNVIWKRIDFLSFLQDLLMIKVISFFFGFARMCNIASIRFFFQLVVQDMYHSFCYKCRKLAVPGGYFGSFHWTSNCCSLPKYFQAAIEPWKGFSFWYDTEGPRGFREACTNYMELYCEELPSFIYSTYACLILLHCVSCLSGFDFRNLNGSW